MRTHTLIHACVRTPACAHTLKSSSELDAERLEEGRLQITAGRDALFYLRCRNIQTVPQPAAQNTEEEASVSS